MEQVIQSTPSKNKSKMEKTRNVLNYSHRVASSVASASGAGITKHTDGTSSSIPDGGETLM